jgi:ElaB/YqjD/DUF883 family membrane-anchored ribosome-binding protein
MKSHSHSHTHKERETVENLMEDAQALLSATASVAEEKVVEARRRLSAAIEKGKDALHTVQQSVVSGAKATDEAIHENPYKAMGIALGAGVLLGIILARRR